jgi:hypothetical protein
MPDGVCNPVPRGAGVTFQSVKDRKKRYPRFYAGRGLQPRPPRSGGNVFYAGRGLQPRP